MNLPRWLRWRSTAELDEEIRSHLDMEIRAHLDRGLSPEDARRAAVLRFGNAALVKERAREGDPLSHLEILSKDVRYALRGLLRTPGFTLAAVVTLALGIGANTAIYQLFDAVLLRSLPVPDSHELVIIETTNAIGVSRRNAAQYAPLSNPVWEQIRDRQDVLQDVMAWGPTTFAPLYLTQDRDSQLLEGLFVSGEFFRVLGVDPIVGRTFTAADDRRGCGLPGAVLSHGFWRRQFGGDLEIVGRTISINSRPVPVVGVTAAGFSGVEVGRSYDVAVPLCSYATLGAEPGWLDDSGLWWLTVMGRLPPGRTPESVNAALAVLSSSIFEATLPADSPADGIDAYLGITLRAVPGETGVSVLRTRYGNPLVFLLATTGLVLLLASTNLANLILARGSAREHEMAVRLAIGASSRRLVRQSLIESALLAIGGGAAGLALAAALSRVLLGFFGEGLSVNLGLDLQLIAFLVGAATVACVTFGLVPAWRASRLPAAEALGDGRRPSCSAHRGVGFRKALVVSQVALSLVLVFGAVLFAGTLVNLLAVDTGFDIDGVLVARVDYDALEVPQESRLAFTRGLRQRIGALPGVTSVAETRHVPMGGTGTNLHAWPGGASSDDRQVMGFNFTTEGYLDTMGIPLLAGRDFGRDDTGRPVAIVNQILAGRLELEHPVGQRFQIELGGRELAVEIVGLVPDTKYFNDLREDPFPIALMPTGVASDERPHADFMVRSALPIGDTAAAIRRALDAFGSGVQVDIRPFSDTIRNLLLPERLMATLAILFGVIAMTMASVGLYGVVADMVTRRRSEIGVRVALGSTRWGILSLVLAQSGRLVVIGCAAGSVLALAAAGLVRSLVFGIEPRSVETVGLACGLLTLVAAAACYVPARRAARLDPHEALRAG
jgi:putative ABC transport system permease protein